MRDNQPNTRTRRGKLLQYLRRNYFLVTLDDGQQITAAMPKELFHLYDASLPLTKLNGAPVEVLIRKPPRMPIIVGSKGVTIMGQGW